MDDQPSQEKYQKIDEETTSSGENPTFSTKNDDDDNENEEKNFEQVIINAFRYYKRHSINSLKPQLAAYASLPARHRSLLQTTYPPHLKRLKQCVVHNHKILQEMLAGIGQLFENRNHRTDNVQVTPIQPASELHMDKLRSTLRQIVRDWSAEGKSERDCCYQRVLDALERRFPIDADRQRHEIKVLVPGAGLARLAWDIARLGFSCQGNEFSLFMLFVSNFMLNRIGAEQVEKYYIYPFIHQTCNNLTYEDQLRAVHFPDVDPSGISKKSNSFSMTAGDFLEVYQHDDAKWDCVVSVFFLDTARNIIDYIDAIHRILKPNGVWINFGPLLYHFADSHEHQSIELPYEEALRLVESIGFRVEKHELDIATGYTTNIRSMLQYQYRCAYFECVKQPTADNRDIHVSRIKWIGVFHDDISEKLSLSKRKVFTDADEKKISDLCKREDVRNDVVIMREFNLILKHHESYQIEAIGSWTRNYSYLIEIYLPKKIPEMNKTVMNESSSDGESSRLSF